MTQTEMIRKHMDKYGSLTALDAMHMYGIMRLASRMSDLKAAGYPFYTETVKAKNRYGEKVAFVKYIKGVKKCSSDA